MRRLLIALFVVDKCIDSIHRSPPVLNRRPFDWRPAALPSGQLVLTSRRRILASVADELTSSRRLRGATRDQLLRSATREQPLRTRATPVFFKVPTPHILTARKDWQNEVRSLFALSCEYRYSEMLPMLEGVSLPMRQHDVCQIP